MPRTVVKLAVLVPLLAGCTRTVYVPAAPSPANPFDAPPTYSPAYSYSPPPAYSYSPPAPPAFSYSPSEYTNYLEWRATESTLALNCSRAGGTWASGSMPVHGTCLSY